MTISEHGRSPPKAEGSAIDPGGSVEVFNDITSVTLNTAIAGLAARQRVTTDNIANLETPGFQARAVKFEDNLTDALGSKHPEQARIENLETGDLPGQNGNNVNLERELITATKTGLQQKLITGTVTSRFGWMASVLKG
jgi:flagellar basal-body rod protein FlgB